jgi:hypothetical protein
VQVPDLFADMSHRLPFELVEPIEKMLSWDYDKRPNAELFTLVLFLLTRLIRAKRTCATYCGVDCGRACDVRWPTE